MATKYSKNIERNFILGLTAIFLVLTFFIIKDIITILVFSAILSYFLFPLYKKYLSKIENERICAILALITSIFIIFLPITLLSYFLILNLVKLVIEYREYIENPELLNIALSGFLNEITNSTILTSIDFSGIIINLVTFILELTTSFFSNIPKYIAYFVIMLFISYYILTHNKKIFKTANEFIPISLYKQNQIVKNIEKNVTTLFKGYFLTGIAQTLVAFIGYWIFGAPNLLIITFLTLFTSLIPYLGTPLIWAPVAFYMIYTGNEIGGLWLLIYGTLIINLVDNFLRPILMSSKETLSPPLVFIGFVGGFLAFGFAGIILGPLVIAITSILLKYVKETLEI